jgi:regulator of replication initiation timing
MNLQTVFRTVDSCRKEYDSLLRENIALRQHVRHLEETVEDLKGEIEAKGSGSGKADS